MRIINTTLRHIPVILVIVCLSLCTGCSPSGNNAPQISELDATTMYVYPKGKSTINCIATDPEGDEITFKWSCSDGEITGSGPVITWKAPNKYGDFHVMVVAQDSNGNTDEATLTIGVLVRENAQKSCCGR
jgi:hypothetical protein